MHIIKLMWAVTHVLKSGVLDLLIGLAPLVALLMFAGLIIQAIGTARDARRFPPPGRLVDIGGHRLQSAKNHTLCLRQQLLLGL